MNNRDKVVVFGMGDLEDWVGSCLPFTTGVTRSISLGGGGVKRVSALQN